MVKSKKYDMSVSQIEFVEVNALWKILEHSLKAI